MNVFITYDVELWPTDWNLSESAFRDAFDRCILGKTNHGEYGLNFQLNLLREHDLNAVCFIESLFSNISGESLLADIVDIAHSHEQDAQLHLHLEWSHRGANPLRQGDLVYNLNQLPLEQQIHLIGTGKQLLEYAGAQQVHAFRAGNYGADNNTLKALVQCGFNIDSSYNYTFRDSHCQIKTTERLTTVTELEGIAEYPITFFQDFPGHFRHMQLNACSFKEIKSVLEGAYDQECHDVVLVLHSFELLDAAKQKAPKMLVRRFENLCRYLADNKDKYGTLTFESLTDTNIQKSIASETTEPVKSSMITTTERVVQQAIASVLPDI